MVLELAQVPRETTTACGAIAPVGSAASLTSPILQPAENLALMVSTADGDVRAVRLLLNNHADPNHTDASGWTPLMMACMRAHVACARLLLDHGAEVDRCNHDGVTALMLACIADSKACAMLLCFHGASRDLTNKHGRPAGYFARQNNPQLARWLEKTRHYVSLLHYLDGGLLTAQRTRELLTEGASPHARARGVVGAPSPLDVARALERAGEAPAGSPAEVVLGWWRERLRALAMGTHCRLGSGSSVRLLGGVPEVLDLIVQRLAAAEGAEATTDAPSAEGGAATAARTGCKARGLKRARLSSVRWLPKGP